MENEWEILDDFEWVRYWFVWLRIFNNFVNMVIWTFWTLSIFYTFWLFLFTKEMHFLSYYIFLYSLYVNVFALVFLDDHLYFSAERNRAEERRIRIEKARANDHLHAVLQRTQKLIDRVKLYPRFKEFVKAQKREGSSIHPVQLMAFLARERRRAVDQLELEMELEMEAKKAEMEALKEESNVSDVK